MMFTPLSYLTFILKHHLAYQKILTLSLFQRIYEVGWPLLFFILVALFPHLNIANPSFFFKISYDNESIYFYEIVIVQWVIIWSRAIK